MRWVDAVAQRPDVFERIEPFASLVLAFACIISVAYYLSHLPIKRLDQKARSRHFAIKWQVNWDYWLEKPMSDQIFTGDVPRHYDAGLGPVIFQDYANDIAARTAVLAPSDVLEVAAGTGIVSRRLRDVLPSTTQLVATDLSAPMLEIARAKFAPGEAIEILPADALALPFGEDAFDAVVCQFGAMFFPDKTKAFSEAARVLRPGGRFLFSCWGSPAENPRVAVTEAVFARLCGRNHNASALIPYSYCDPAQVMADLRTAGWVDVVFERLAIRVAVRDLEGFARGIVFGSVRVLDVLKSGADPEALVVELMEEFQQVLGPGDLHMGTVAYLYECRKA